MDLTNRYGDRPPPIDLFTLTSVTNNTAVLFGGNTRTSDYNNNLYIINFRKTSVVSYNFLYL